MTSSGDDKSGENSDHDKSTDDDSETGKGDSGASNGKHSFGGYTSQFSRLACPNILFTCSIVDIGRQATTSGAT